MLITSDWTAFNPSPSKVTALVNVLKTLKVIPSSIATPTFGGYYRRVGDSMELKITAGHTDIINGLAFFVWSAAVLPAGYSVRANSSPIVTAIFGRSHSFKVPIEGWNNDIP